MDHKQKKALKQEYCRLVVKLERLLKRFTPINPPDEYSDGNEYENLVPSLVSMLTRGCDREELFRKLESFRMNSWRRVPPTNPGHNWEIAEAVSNPDLDWKIADAVLKAFRTKEKVARKASKGPRTLVRLDLRIDYDQILNYVEEQISQFVEKSRSASLETNLIRLIEFGYEHSQSGWVIINFDIRPDAQSDGEWTLAIDDRKLEREHWRKASVANLRNAVYVVSHDGTERLIPEENVDGMSESIGQMLRAVLLHARDEKLFFRLPLAPTCKLAVEDFDGNFGWPLGDYIGIENLVQPT